MSRPPAIERLLLRDRLIVATGLAALTALAWLYIVRGAGMGMGAWDMTVLALFPHRSALPEAPSMAPPSEGPRAWLIMLGMWWVMMIAMMTPSAAPAVLLYARVHRHAAQGKEGGVAPTTAFAAGYLLAWLGFSVAAVAAHYALEGLGLVRAMMMSSQSRWLSAGVLIAAGLYQLSPLKSVCLRQCRSPAQFLSRHWRPGTLGALRLGALHGAYCVGCCWALMALLFVGGVMNLAWIAAIALLVLVEKAFPGGPWIGRGAGLILIAWGAATLFL
jgi:predicted metal-binding membrane protein